jgi:hypothetical protein
MSMKTLNFDFSIFSFSDYLKHLVCFKKDYLGNTVLLLCTGGLYPPPFFFYFFVPIFFIFLYPFTLLYDCKEISLILITGVGVKFTPYELVPILSNTLFCTILYLLFELQGVMLKSWPSCNNFIFIYFKHLE